MVGVSVTPYEGSIPFTRSIDNEALTKYSAGIEAQIQLFAAVSRPWPALQTAPGHNTDFASENTRTQRKKERLIGGWTGQAIARAVRR